MPKYLLVGDAHFPFADAQVLAWVYKISEKLKPDYIVQMGDLYDLFSFGRWAKSLDLTTPKQEVEEGRAMAEAFWKHLKKGSPRAECFQIIGNHDARVSKQLLDKFPEIAGIVDFSHLWKFPGVKSQPSEREELFLNHICFMHGYRSKLGDHSKYNQMPTVVGHSHTGGVVFQRQRDRIIWELNCGYIGNPESLALSYGMQKKISHWTLGVGIIDDLGPRFIPYPGNR